VVQAGESTVVIFGFSNPAFSRAISISNAMTFIAGQPE